MCRSLFSMLWWALAIDFVWMETRCLQARLGPSWRWRTLLYCWYVESPFRVFITSCFKLWNEWMNPCNESMNTRTSLGSLSVLVEWEAFKWDILKFRSVQTASTMCALPCVSRYVSVHLRGVSFSVLLSLVARTEARENFKLKEPTWVANKDQLRNSLKSLEAVTWCHLITV